MKGYGPDLGQTANGSRAMYIVTAAATVGHGFALCCWQDPRIAYVPNMMKKTNEWV
jgi:hypothetical protein